MQKSVNLFVTCIVDTLYPEIGEAVVKVLANLGISVHLPRGQTCCGQPAFNAGLRSQARPVAEHTIQVLEQTQGDIVIPSGSCTGMIRHGYLELFAQDAEWLPRAKSVAGRTYEFSEYLVDQLKITDVGAEYEGKVTYHSSCHLLRDLGVVNQPRHLLNSVRGIEFVELPESDECCGFGGVFSVEHPSLSAAMFERKIACIEQTEAPIVVSCDAGCLTNINGGLHRRKKVQRVVHIAQILANKNNE